MDIIKETPPKKEFNSMKRYANVKITKKISTKIIDDFFRVFPEEIRGRKSFKSKETGIMALMAYDDLIEKALSVKCDCIGNIKEVVKKETLQVTASFYKKV